MSKYETGFENAATGTIYNSTQTYAASGSKHTDGLAWTAYYGMVSTGSPLTGSNSLQMRWYSFAKNNRPYAHTTTASNSYAVKAFKFDYKASNANWKFDVDYSINGTSWTTIETITPASTNIITYSHVIDGEAISNFFLSFPILRSEIGLSWRFSHRVSPALLAPSSKVVLTNSSVYKTGDGN